MARKPTSTLSEQRRKVDFLRSELQKPSVMKNPRRLTLLQEALAGSEAQLRVRRMQEK